MNKVYVLCGGNGDIYGIYSSVEEAQNRIMEYVYDHSDSDFKFRSLLGTTDNLELNHDSLYFDIADENTNKRIMEFHIEIRAMDSGLTV